MVEQTQRYLKYFTWLLVYDRFYFENMKSHMAIYIRDGLRENYIFNHVLLYYMLFWFDLTVVKKSDVYFVQ